MGPEPSLVIAHTQSCYLIHLFSSLPDSSHNAIGRDYRKRRSRGCTTARVMVSQRFFLMWWHQSHYQRAALAASAWPHSPFCHLSFVHENLSFYLSEIIPPSRSLRVRSASELFLDVSGPKSCKTKRDLSPGCVCVTHKNSHLPRESVSLFLLFGGGRYTQKKCKTLCRRSYGNLNKFKVLWEKVKSADFTMRWEEIIV